MLIHTSLVFIDPGYSKDLRARPGISTGPMAIFQDRY